MKGIMQSVNQDNSLTKLLNDSVKMRISDEIQMVSTASFPHGGRLQKKDVSFFKIDMLSYDDEYPRREAFENVLCAVDNPSFNFVYILEGNDNVIDMYLGVVRNGKKNINNMSPSDYGKNLKYAFEGNFYGSCLKEVKSDKLEYIIGDCHDKFNSAGMLVGIPSINDNSNNKEDFQGIDRLINSMLGSKWRIVVVSEPVDKNEIRKIQDSIYEIYNRLSLCSKMSLQQQKGTSEGSNTSVSYNKSSNYSTSTNNGESFQKGISDSRGSSHGYNDRSSNSNHSTNSSRSENKSTGTTEGISTSNGKSAGKNSSETSSVSYSFEVINKKVQEIMSYIDDELLKRMKIGFSKGLFKTSIYYMAENPVCTSRLKNSIMSLFQGDGSSFSPLVAKDISDNLLNTSSLLFIYQNVYENDVNYSPDVPVLYGRAYENNNIGLNTYLTPSEISLVAGLPQKEVPGIVLKKAVNFGLNQKNISKSCHSDLIELGLIVQKGRILENNRFIIDKKSLSKHTFVAGVTGSGKTTTCHNLLHEFEKPYLVIEPAKTEYRTLINKDNDLIVFTIGNETVAPFRLNPFELIQGEIISSHIDMIKATFTSAFPMEGSMPQLLEEAIIKIYEDKGWNLATNQNEKYGEVAFNEKTDSFPILSDLLKTIQQVVHEKNFGDRLGNEYIGSLVSRLSNLTKGSKGYMLNCKRSVDFEYIAKNNVVLEMDELKSPEDKALIMGFVLTRMSSVIKQLHKKDKNYTHLTLIEEAHRLLSKPEYGDPGSKKSAVETFADMLAEVRKYGEGLIIVDQIPNKLAVEVLKNTNTKIIHKLLAKDDKEAVGDTMLMDDKQKEYLSALPVGQAVVFTENTDKPVNVKIRCVSDTNEAEIEDELVIGRFEEKIHLFDSGCYKYLYISDISKLFFEFLNMELQNGKNTLCDIISKKIMDVAKLKKISNEEALMQLLEYSILEKNKMSDFNEDDIQLIFSKLNMILFEKQIIERTQKNMDFFYSIKILISY